MPNKETPANVELKIEIKLYDSNPNFHVLIGSISENLPSFGKKKVKCIMNP